MEAEIAKDESDGRIAKVKDRLDHYLYEKTREDGGEVRENDPRQGDEAKGDGIEAEAQPDDSMQDATANMDCVDSMTDAEESSTRG